jgi:hypothetical protein
VDGIDKMDYIQSMPLDLEDPRKQARREVHVALDSLLPYLAYEEVVGLLGSLRTLAAWPHVVPRAFSFASDMVRDRMVDGAPAEQGAAPVLALKGGGHGEVLPTAEASRRLETASETVDPNIWAGPGLVSVGELEARLGVRRSTIHNWRTQRRIVGLRKGLRNFVYPTLQFDGKSPVDGLAEVIAAHPDGEAAWEWLVAPNPATAWEPPVNLLRRGEKEAVLRAAGSQLDYA